MVGGVWSWCASVVVWWCGMAVRDGAAPGPHIDTIVGMRLSAATTGVALVLVGTGIVALVRRSRRHHRQPYTTIGAAYGAATDTAARRVLLERVEAGGTFTDKASNTLFAATTGSAPLNECARLISVALARQGAVDPDVLLKETAFDHRWLHLVLASPAAGAISTHVLTSCLLKQPCLSCAGRFVSAPDLDAFAPMFVAHSVSCLFTDRMYYGSGRGVAPDRTLAARVVLYIVDRMIVVDVGTAAALRAIVAALEEQNTRILMERKYSPHETLYADLEAANTVCIEQLGRHVERQQVGCYADGW